MILGYLPEVRCVSLAVEFFLFFLLFNDDAAADDDEDDDVFGSFAIDNTYKCLVCPTGNLESNTGGCGFVVISNSNSG
jgi:hypothetical protein